MVTSWEPTWTSESKIESGGRYPLGLNRFHDALEDFLIKGIVLAANRLRYFTYSCWIIGDIEANENCEKYDEFVDAFNRRENALALGLYLMKPEYGIPGSDAISKIVQDNKEDYDCTFRLMQSNDLGAYGLYYKGSIFDWGLTETSDKGIIRLTETGKELYKIHNDYLKQINPEYYINYRGRGNIPSSVLLEWAQVNDFDNIIDHHEEREFYKSILFRLNQNNSNDFRRHTLLLFLVSIDDCAQNKVVFTENILQDIHYFENYYDNERENVYEISIPDYLKDARLYWMMYEGHAYFRGWISRFFEQFLKYLKSNDSGGTVDGFFYEVEQEQFNETIGLFSGVNDDYINGTMGEILLQLPDTSILNISTSESNITFDNEYETTSGVLAKFVLIMGDIYKKFKFKRSKKYYQHLTGNLSEDLWFDVLFRFKDFENMKVVDLLKVLLNKHVLQQHDQIMMEKRDLRRSWFTTEGQRYFHEADLSLIWRPAKFQTIKNFLEDLKFVEYNEDILTLSEEGKLFLKEISIEGIINGQN